MRKVLMATIALSLFGCNTQAPQHTPGAGGGTGGSAGTGTGGVGTGGSGGSGGNSNCSSNAPGNDNDGDGYTVAQGDCNDCDPNVNPGAIEDPSDGKDNDCNGQTDEKLAACDSSNTGKNDPQSLAQSIELCDQRFLKDAKLGGDATHVPVDKARKVMAGFGILKPVVGANMMLLSTGVAAGKSDPGYVSPQPGTELGMDYNNPLPNLKGASNCGQSDQTQANDYTELVYTLKAPTNVKSFSFQFNFFSAEYPEWVCSEFNDEFLVVVQSSKTYTTPTNISFDMNQNPITVNSGFFTVCTNDTSKPQTQHCTHPVSDIAGTGYEDDPLKIQPVGGATGWLTTTAPIEPGEDITLRFVIFDEGDEDLDSAVLIDGFQWGAATVSGPVTVPISYRTKKHKRYDEAALMCMG